MHGANAAPSRRHWNVDGSLAEKLKVADVSDTGPDGPESINVLGRVVSGVGLRSNGAKPIPYVVFAPESFAVAADPEPVRGGEQDPGAVIARRDGGIPSECHAGHRVDGADARAGDCTGTGRVAAIGVVQPALMAADVHRRSGDGHAPESVAAGPVDPGGLDRAADVRGFEPGRSITYPVGTVVPPVETITK